MNKELLLLFRSLVFIFISLRSLLGIVFFLVVGITSTFSQSSSPSLINVSGKVLDTNNEPLVGASVVVRGTTNGVLTDLEGNYTLSGVPVDGHLVFSFLGFIQREEPVKGRHTINQTMQEDVLNLDQVVVIGYGTTTQKKVASSISKVSAKELVKAPVASVTQSLAGQASGLIVTQSGGGLNKGTTSVSIRGGGQPLVYIDGIISSWGDFQSLNAEDIQDMTILKDAAATAVYGSRAGDGAIVVTTKKGSGKLSVEYSFSYMLSTVVKPINKLSSFDIANNKNRINSLYGRDPVYTDEELLKFYTGSDPYKYPNTDWNKEVLRDFAPESRHNLLIQGGEDKSRYYFSLGAYEQQSLFKTDVHWLKRYNFRLQSSHLIDVLGLRVTPRISGYLEEWNSPKSISASNGGIDGNYYYIFSHLQNRSPMNPAYNRFGQITGSDFDNPLIETSPNSGYTRNNESKVIGQLDLEWTNPNIQGLALRANGNYQIYTHQNKSWNQTAPVYDLEGVQSPLRSADLSKYFYYDTYWTLQALIDYNRTFGKHSISAMGAYETSRFLSNDLSGSRRNYRILIDQIGVGPEEGQTNKSDESESGRAAYISRLKYDFDDRYIIEGTMRYDGSDLFPPDKRWGLFFSGSVAWNISNERFFNWFKQHNIINFLKLRFSYGETGLTDGLGRFEYIASYNYNGRGSVINGVYVPTFSEGKLPSGDISWYTRYTSDWGLDFETLGGRLKGSLDYYYIRTKGYLASPSSTIFTDPLGISLPMVRSDGEHRRHGWDFSLSWNHSVGDFSYSVGGNMTYYEQMVSVNWKESSEAIKNPYTRNAQSTRRSGMLTYYNDGLYQSYQELIANPRRDGSNGLSSGDIKYKDINGDGYIDGDDQRYSGSPDTPSLNYGIFGQISWKGINFYMLWQGASRTDKYLGDRMRSSNAEMYYDFQLDYWTPDNRDARYPRPVLSNADNGDNNQVLTDFWFVDGEYIRLKTVSLGYDLKRSLLKNFKWLNRLELSFSAQNLFTISPATAFEMDPEIRDLNNYYYPMTRTFSFNVRVGF